jgi:hypothetical protein
MNLSKITNGGDDVTMKPGYQIGVGMDYYFTKSWGIQPSLMLIGKGSKYRFPFYWGDLLDDDNMYHIPNALASITETRIYVQIPVMLAYRANVSKTLKLVFNGGGYVSYGVGGKTEFVNILIPTCSIYIPPDNEFRESTVDTFFEGTQRFDFGLGTGAMLEIRKRYTLALFGEWGLIDAHTHRQVSPGKITNQTYGLNIGYKF